MSFCLRITKIDILLLLRKLHQSNFNMKLIKYFIWFDKSNVTFCSVCIFIKKKVKQPYCFGRGGGNHYGSEKNGFNIFTHQTSNMAGMWYNCFLLAGMHESDLRCKNVSCQFKLTRCRNWSVSLIFLVLFCVVGL